LEFVFELICFSFFWILSLNFFFFSHFVLFFSVYVGANLVVYDKSFKIES
jgi:hypothetical protein